ncbi:MAG: MOSC domain-containing protein [Gemmatimonadaceae bacterium]
MPRTLTIGELWRYPVKTLAGERIDATELTPDGIPGDRLVHVRGPEGVRTSRRHYRLLGLQGSLSPEGVALVNGHRWDSADALALVKQAAGDDAWLEAYGGPERFDILPLLVATDGAVREFGRDVRRLRPNIVIAGVDGMDETTWEEATLEVNGAVIYLDSLRGRCPMTTVDPDTLVRDPGVLRDIGTRFGGRLALNAAVLKGGHVRLGDAVRLCRP